MCSWYNTDNFLPLFMYAFTKRVCTTFLKFAWVPNNTKETERPPSITYRWANRLNEWAKSALIYGYKAAALSRTRDDQRQRENTGTETDRDQYPAIYWQNCVLYHYIFSWIYNKIPKSLEVLTLELQLINNIKFYKMPPRWTKMLFVRMLLFLWYLHLRKCI